jgi:hypothetical protein
MAIVCSPQQLNKFTTALPQAKIIGEVIKAKDEERVIID